MANQSPDRREILSMLARISALSQFPGFSRWVCASQHAHTSPAPERSASYSPVFFTPAEYQTLDHLTELILPRDESPGASDAGVAEFIDFLVAHDESLQYPFRTGLAWLNARAQNEGSATFLALPVSHQETLLTQCAARVPESTTPTLGHEFFSRLREYTVIGYYTSRIGFEALDNPGLHFYSSSPECPHRDDPEHLHLPAPKN